MQGVLSWCVGQIFVSSVSVSSDGSKTNLTSGIVILPFSVISSTTLIRLSYLGCRMITRPNIHSLGRRYLSLMTTWPPTFIFGCEFLDFMRFCIRVRYSVFHLRLNVLQRAFNFCHQLISQAGVSLMSNFGGANKCPRTRKCPEVCCSKSVGSLKDGEIGRELR